MRSVLIIVNTLGFDVRNSNSAVANFINEIHGFLQSKNNFEVDVTSANNDNDIRTTESRKGKNKIKTLLKLYAPFLYNTLVAYKLKKFQASQLLKYKKNKYDLIIEFYTIGSELGMKLKNESKAKYILIYDCPVLEQFREMHQSHTLFDLMFLKAERNSIKSADGIWCYSNYMKEYIKRTYKYGKKFLVSPCIVWKKPQEYFSQNNEITIGFIGSFLTWHKVDLLVYAFNLIAEKYPHANLYLIGYGQEWQRVKTLALKSKFKNRITMTGYVNEEELDKYKAMFTIGIMPGSNWYGSPLKLFEYAQSGIPIIAPSTPVVKELFKEEETAVFIDNNDEINSIADNLEKLITNKFLSLQIAKNAEALMRTIYSRSHQQEEFSKFIDQFVVN